MDSRSGNPVAIVKTVIAALNRGDVEQVLSLCDPDVVLWAPGPDLTGQRVMGVDELRAVLENAEECWPDSWTSIDSMMGEGDRVAVEMTVVATEEGVALKQPMAAFFTIRDGLIVEQRSYYDLRALEKRLGE